MKKWNGRYHDRYKRCSQKGQLLEPRRLHEAWLKVKANKGAGGIDGENIEHSGAGLERNLLEIQRQIKENRYGLQPVRRVCIPKADGGKRPLGIPAVRDRVVQQAVKDALEPIYEEIFLPCSHGYRPGIYAHQAIRKAEDRFRDAIRHKTRRQQPKNIRTVIQGINSIISGWGRYFCGGTVRELFRTLGSWICSRIRSSGPREGQRA